MEMESSGGSVGSVARFGAPRCHCCEIARMRTSWTRYNPGRRFWTCANYGSPKVCDFFAWHDAPTCPRGMQILPRLLERTNTLQTEVEMYQQRERGKSRGRGARAEAGAWTVTVTGMRGR